MMPDGPDLITIRDRMTNRRDELRQELERLTRPPAEGATVSFGKRVGEGTAEAVERMSSTAAARSIASSIKDLDRALEKIEDGSYGVCDVCGRPISPARLEALPAAALCVECAGSR